MYKGALLGYFETGEGAVHTSPPPPPPPPPERRLYMEGKQGEGSSYRKLDPQKTTEEAFFIQ